MYSLVFLLLQIISPMLIIAPIKNDTNVIIIILNYIFSKLFVFVKEKK